MSYSTEVNWRQTYGPKAVRIGTTGVGVYANHFTADGKNFVTELVFDGAVFPAVTGSLSVGLLAYTFPAGVHALKSSRIAVALTAADGNNDDDTPEIGLGDTIGSGANTQLSSVAASENILTGQVMDDCSGTVEDKTILQATAGHLINEAAGTKTLYLNVADGWAGAEAAMPISGSVWLEWTRLSGK